MSKHSQLQKKTIKVGVIAAVIVGLVGAVYAGISMYASSVAEQKTAADSKFDADNALLSSLRDQMDKSGEAEKRYAAIQASRTTDAFETNRKLMIDYLSAARQKFKFDNFKFSPATMAVSDKPELANFSYNINVWPRFKITFRAVSDLHIFSFLEELKTGVPGFVRVDSIEVKRLSDFSDQSIAAIKSSGSMPLNVEAKIEFTWIGLSPKEKDKPANTNPATLQ